MSSVCPYCEDIREVKVVTRSETRDVKGFSVPEVRSADAVYSVCLSCGGEFCTSEQMEQSVNNSLDVYRDLFHLIRPEEIVAVRKKYGISQKAFARILGFGELTINSYEQGTVPTKASSNFIKLVEDTEIFLKLYEMNRGELSPAQQKKTDRKIEELLCDEKEWEMRVDQVYRFVERKRTALAEPKESAYEVSRSFSDALSQKLNSKLQ